MRVRNSWFTGISLFGIGIILILIGLGILYQADIPGTMPHASGDPLAQIGKAFRSDEIELIHSKGMSRVNIAEHVPRIIRLDEKATVDFMETGHIGNVQENTIDVSKGKVEYPVNGAPWGEQPSCLVWQFEDVQLGQNDDFGGIELKITDRRQDVHNFHVSFLSRIATVPMAPGKSMTYFIVPDMATRPNSTPVLDSRKSLDVVFPGINDRDEIELHSLKILSKSARYAHTTRGYGYETLDHETRPILYQWTDGLLAWKAKIPSNSAVLKFGTGLLPRSSPVTFSISVLSNNCEKEVFNKTIEYGDKWTDYAVDLSYWEKKSIIILFRVSSVSPSVALWSSPRVVESGRKGKLFCLYVVDALRADACQGFATIGQNNVTPAIRNLSRRGVSFTNALANAPITQYSVGSLLSGRYPSHTGIMIYQRLPDGILTLPEILRQNGFVTASFVLNSNAGRMRGMHQGYDYLYEIERISNEAQNLQVIRGKDIYEMNPVLTSAGLINNFLFNFIRTHQDEDLFLYLHLMDTHTPYVPDEEFLSEFYQLMAKKGITVPKDHAVLLNELKYTQRPNYIPKEHLSEEALLELYREAARTADKHLQKFMDFLRSEGRDTEATLVFTADHGEHLNEHPNIRLFTHMHPMLLEVLRIPLIIYSPGILPNERIIEQPVQLTDVMPTLLDLAGINYEPSQFDGISLVVLATGKENHFFSKRPIISQSCAYWSVMVENLHCPDITAGYNAMVYNINNDPHEHRALQGRPARKAMDTLLHSLAMIPQRSVPGEDTIVANELALQQLKDLGYVQ